MTFSSYAYYTIPGHAIIKIVGNFERGPTYSSEPWQSSADLNNYFARSFKDHPTFHKYCAGTGWMLANIIITWVGLAHTSCAANGRIEESLTRLSFTFTNKRNYDDTFSFIEAADVILRTFKNDDCRSIEALSHHVETMAATLIIANNECSLSGDLKNMRMRDRLRYVIGTLELPSED